MDGFGRATGGTFSCKILVGLLMESEARFGFDGSCSRRFCDFAFKEDMILHDVSKGQWETSAGAYL